MKRKDSDIVETLLAGETDRQPDSAFWCGVLASVRQDAAKQQALRRRAVEHAALRLHGESRPAARHAVRPLVWAAAVGTVVLAAVALSWRDVPLPVKNQPTKAAHAPQSAPEPEVYVAFEHAGPGKGTVQAPFTSLQLGLASVEAGGTVTIRGGATTEAVRIDKPVKLRAQNGPVQIGKKQT